MTVKSGELLPLLSCPFCGKELILINGGNSLYHEMIAGCVLRGFMFPNIKKERDDWNRRVPSTPKAVSSDALWINGMCCSGHPNCIHAPKSKNYTSTERIIEMIDELPKADDELALQLQAEIKSHNITKESLAWWIRECKRLKAGEVDREEVVRLMAKEATSDRFTPEMMAEGMLSAIESRFTLVPKEEK